jgi:heme O synthase-like polyprenyltransferase
MSAEMSAENAPALRDRPGPVRTRRRPQPQPRVRPRLADVEAVLFLLASGHVLWLWATWPS